MYIRDLYSLIGNALQAKEYIVLYGARQIGKTTLLEQLFASRSDALIINCERPETQKILESQSLQEIKLLFGNYQIIALDEAQSIQDIGKLLKILYDSHDFSHKIIATGSSSFELSEKVSEALTGRHITCNMYPLLYSEVMQKKSWIWMRENMGELLLFGMYPGVIDKNIHEKPIFLSQLASDYLFKDILSFENIRNPKTLKKLVQLLAWQIGSQVSFHELATQLGVSVHTIERYIDLLEKSFVIYGLDSYSRNLRNELKKSNKYYFYDVGIRNAVINNFAPLSARNDVGALWENFCVMERIKLLKTHQDLSNFYFWRTYDGAEVDLVEEKNGVVQAFEYKYSSKKKTSFPKSFVETYSPQITMVVTPENIHEMLLL